MAEATFQTNPVLLHELLKACHAGKMQLPDFQRSWVWDEDRIKSLVASISRAFPVGAVMTLRTGGAVNFKPRPIEGTPDDIRPEDADFLLLDGQQRMTSMYQVALRDHVVRTVTPKNKPVDRWFYLDIRKCLDPQEDREAAIIGVPADRVLRSDFNRTVVLDLSTPEREFEELMYPVSRVFAWNDWNNRFLKYAYTHGRENLLPVIIDFFEQVISNFQQYQVPVISLASSTSKEAVCTVFEKVNTGGKALDAFELVTAMYAAEGHELRKDWYGKGSEPGRHHRLIETLRQGGQDRGILAEVANTDFLQAVALFHNRDRRRQAEVDGKQGKELPSIAPTRQAILNLPLASYKKYESVVEAGFVKAAKFLHRLHIYRVFDLPYQSQVVPLAAILADLGDAADHEANHGKLVCWYWNGVFGELYGSAIESRFARDFLEVPVWILRGGDLPSTIRDSTFRADRLKTMRMRLSAAYKGVNALLMKEGATDWRSGQTFDHTVFFGESVDIHHIFPKDWCLKNNLKWEVFDSIINKTPLSYRTNRIIGGSAPSAYLARLESADSDGPGIDRDRLDGFLASHLIDPALLRADAFETFMADRQAKLLRLIENATGQAVYRDTEIEATDEDETDEETFESSRTMEAAQ
ncbi:conserved hypothetical protein [uncultured Pleomorphomonas sp.]|uniref:GmrSD restriction endonucleases N-terminal domain-containing protein n=1 Tax=uncultured Pleomorphomonas sp. TaxID=442121 RepID=A0A212LAA3_9HYPH|nr:DUF262 domain-containing protein [uncultured Pleomorphomonas sp.]SCM74259.1 conserved hypothetical protein [uncultured Pleomorphomonas sp.]